MNELQVFQYNNTEIRTIEKDGVLWWVLSDVCKVLGLSTPARVAERLEADENGMSQIHTPGGRQEVTVVNEPGLYSVILRSDKPEARNFKHWVIHDVLPSIRKHGVYITPNTIEKLLTNPDTIIQLATALKDEQNKRRALEAANSQLTKENQDMQPKALFADAVSTAKTTILIGELAKLLKQNGIEMGQNRLFGWMRDNGYLIRRKGIDYNMPTQYAMEIGLFEIKETAITHSDGHVTINKTPKVTGKGQQYFVNQFLKDRISA